MKPVGLHDDVAPIEIPSDPVTSYTITLTPTSTPPPTPEPSKALGVDPVGVDVPNGEAEAGGPGGEDEQAPGASPGKEGPAGESIWDWAKDKFGKAWTWTTGKAGEVWDKIKGGAGDAGAGASAGSPGEAQHG